MGVVKEYNWRTGRYSLVCDHCSNAGKASRVSCPIRYCSTVVLCVSCAKSTGWRKKETHAKCYEAAAVMENERVAFLALNGNKWVVVSAWGSWAEWVPDKMVGVCAYRGGNAAGRKGEPAYFLVPEEEYHNRDYNGFIIDETRHAQFSNDPTQLVSKEVTLV